MQNYPWFKSYPKDVPHSLEPYPQKTPIDTLSDIVAKNPGHTMLLFRDRYISWSEVDRFSDALAAALVDSGVKKGDRVAVLFLNCPQTFIAFFGIWKAGGIVVPMNPLYTPSEIEHALKETGAEIAMIIDVWYPVIKGLQEKTSLRKIIVTQLDEYALDKTASAERKTQIGAGDVRWSDLMAAFNGKKRPNVSIRPQDPSTILFSGGTTGVPKGVVGSHIAYTMFALQAGAWVKAAIESTDPWMRTSIVPLPLFHVSGVFGCFGFNLVHHITMVLIDDPRNVKLIIETIRKYKVTFFGGTPTTFISMINSPDRKPEDLKSIKGCTSGAAPLMADTKKRFEELIDGSVIEGYSLTEAFNACIMSPASEKWKEGSVGMPYPDVFVRIVDADTGKQEIKAGEVGEILIKAPQLMLGYLNRPKETAEVLRDGWLFTGDMGYLDEDGYLFLTSRKKDVIKCSGFQVWPAEVEGVLMEHPAVAEACVAGVPDAKQVEAVKAWIILRQGQQVTAEELQQHCRKKLVAYKVPKLIEFRKELPKTLAGKPLRRILQEGEKTKQS